MENIAERSLHLSRTFNVPLKTMWEAWTIPEQIAVWWGPNGFTNTIHIMDFKVDGEWKLTMHGPDGQNYANRSVFREIIPFEKIVMEHFNPHFIATIKFTDLGNATLIDWHSLFDTIENFTIVVKTFKADEGQKQNLDRLEMFFNPTV
ncbi:MAG: SRPBCC domain-containing protein [Chitinophagales bacterium]|nr:SRPBCC domain-containing protein [Bacteroidota bacterium]